MKSDKTLLLLIVLSLPSIGVSQAPNPDLILERCAQAMGSPSPSLQVVAEGDMLRTDSDSATEIRIKSRGLRDFRFETKELSQVKLSIVSKGRGWYKGENRTSAMARHTAAYFIADHLPALVCGVPPGTRGLRVTYVGSDVVDMRPVFHLKLDAVPHGKNKQSDAIESLISEYHVFIDQRSFTVLKTSKLVFAPDAIPNHSLWETLYSDYRTVNGVQMPFRLENFVSGQKFSTAVFITIRTDVNVPDQDFQEVQ